jgi:hypothetical protein
MRSDFPPIFLVSSLNYALLDILLCHFISWNCVCVADANVFQKYGELQMGPYS